MLGETHRIRNSAYTEHAFYSTDSLTSCVPRLPRTRILTVHEAVRRKRKELSVLHYCLTSESKATDGNVQPSEILGGF